MSSRRLFWSEYDRYVTRLFAHLHREAPAGFSRVSMAQIVVADRRVFAKLIERDNKVFVGQCIG